MDYPINGRRTKVDDLTCNNNTSCPKFQWYENRPRFTHPSNIIWWENIDHGTDFVERPILKRLRYARRMSRSVLSSDVNGEKWRKKNVFVKQPTMKRLPNSSPDVVGSTNQARHTVPASKNVNLHSGFIFYVVHYSRQLQVVENGPPSEKNGYMEFHVFHVG